MNATCWLFPALSVLMLSACSGHRPALDGPGAPRLTPCVRTTNCVCSDDSGRASEIEPFVIQGNAELAWETLRSALTSATRTRITDETPRYLRAECRSFLFRFVDDLEFQLRPDEDGEGGLIAVRSSARVGISDLGVNRRRVEGYRQILQRAGVVEPSSTP